MAYFDCVAEGIYIGIGSLHIIVYGNVGSDLFAAAEVYGHTTVFFFKAADTIF